MHRGLMRRHALRLSAASATILTLAAGCGGDAPPDLGPPVSRGAVSISWTLFDASGEEISCAAVGAVDAYVALGGEPTIVACGDEQRVEFTDLVPQRYPLVLRLRGFAETTIPQGELFDNVVVEGDQTKDVALEIRFDEDNGTTGEARLDWRVNSMPAATGCAEAGGVSVHGETTAASIADFSFDVPCTDGSYTQSNLRPGNYEVRMSLVGETGENITARTATFRVLRQSTAEDSVDFAAGSRVTSAMLARWTISSSTAAEACREDWSVRLLVQQDGVSPIETASATAACDLGEYLLDDLPSPVNPDLSRYKLTVTLVETLRGDLDRVLKEDLQLFPSRTTTVTADLTPPE